MAATPGGQSDALESLLQEIDAAETRLASFLSGPGKLDQQMSDGEEELSYLVEEINLLKKFSNPHIIRFIEAFENPGQVIHMYVIQQIHPKNNFLL